VGFGVRLGAVFARLRRVLLGLFVVARLVVYGGQVMMLGGLRMSLRRVQVVLGRDR